MDVGWIVQEDKPVGNWAEAGSWGSKCELLGAIIKGFQKIDGQVIILHACRWEGRFPSPRITGSVHWGLGALPPGASSQPVSGLARKNWLAPLSRQNLGVS